MQFEQERIGDLQQSQRIVGQALAQEPLRRPEVRLRLVRGHQVALVLLGRERPAGRQLRDGLVHTGQRALGDVDALLGRLGLGGDAGAAGQGEL